jgi:hypothetical protein
VWGPSRSCGAVVYYTCTNLRACITSGILANVQSDSSLVKPVLLKHYSNTKELLHAEVTLRGPVSARWSFFLVLQQGASAVDAAWHVSFGNENAAPSPKAGGTSVHKIAQLAGPSAVSAMCNLNRIAGAATLALNGLAIFRCAALHQNAHALCFCFFQSNTCARLLCFPCQAHVRSALKAPFQSAFTPAPAPRPRQLYGEHKFTQMNDPFCERFAGQRCLLVA